ncbi:FadR/GntR family transcriptional regulator [Yinghuangia seranimata]|uniref:FadR/GntR family transcriptional regulator n=1 Tax=Yinghuangia seranimata TaxID=408067 RepID=UPI00248B9054|nr:FCD domain-containing protein [Yinghuangia seranimata]MDI2128279.1 FCD domain-containing protein [Yinghuangia seranimata]
MTERRGLGAGGAASVRALPPGDAEAVRHHSIADAVAARLRARILDGAIPDGGTLPKQDDLMAEFGVGRTTVRQAFRVLETEGLITVRRGNAGGAVVHVPQPADAAHMFGMVMHARHVPLEDLAGALRQLEPVCAALCASRADRATAVVPHLEAVHARMADVLDDGDAFLRENRAFHEALVERCGNATMQILLGAVEVLWARQEQVWADAALADTARAVREASLRDHGKLIALIAAGDDTEVYRLASRHIAGAQEYPLRAHSARPVKV